MIMKVTVGNLVAALKKAGFKVKDKETTEGAYKTWLELRKVEKGKSYFVETMDAARNALTPFGIRFYDNDGCGFRGRGWELEYQNEWEYRGIFLAIYKGRPREVEYAHGIDC